MDNSIETTQRVLMGLVQEHGIKAVIDQLAEVCFALARETEPGSAHRIIEPKRYGDGLKALAWSSTATRERGTR